MESVGKRRYSALLANAHHHAILIIAYQMLKNDEPYRELGANYFDNLKPEKTANRLIRRLQNMGYEVSISKRSDYN